MPSFQVDPACTLHYTIDDFTDPWTAPETVVFVPGLAEGGEAFRAFVPWFARTYRVVRLDPRGFGQSTPMPADYPWRFDTLVDDLAAFCAHLQAGPVHLVAGKVAGTFALAFAARHPDLVRTLVTLGSPASVVGVKTQPTAWIERIRAEGVRAWARATQRARMGSAMSDAAIEWWSDEMGRTAVSTMEGFLRMVVTADARGDVKNIRCPTLVVTTSGSDISTVEETRAWQQEIPRSELLIVEADSYHVAASHPDEIAERVLRFIREARA